MKVYHYDSNGYYSGSRECQKDPMNPGKFLVPPKSTEVAPPVTPLAVGTNWLWKNNAWILSPTMAAIKAKADADAQAAAVAAAAKISPADATAAVTPAGAAPTPATSGK